MEQYLVKPTLGIWLEDDICDLEIIVQSLQQTKLDEIVSQTQKRSVHLNIVTIL